MKTRICFLFLLFCCISLYSQKPPSKFGKISPEELSINVCPIDSNASAYFMFDFGTTDFFYQGTQVRSNDPAGNKGFRLKFKRHFRLKILHKDGFGWADIEIYLYNNRRNTEELSGLEAFTYNLENGKIIKSKFDKGTMIREEYSTNLDILKIPMPSVKEGSIIEVSYTINSDFLFNLQEWDFQHTIPVLQSEYHVSIPEYFYYNQTQTGYYPIERTSEVLHDKISITYTQQAEGLSQQGGKWTEDYEFQLNVFHALAKNIPAFPMEKYLKTANNYLSKLKFELAYTKYPESKVNYYTTSWEAINKDLLENEYFGYELRSTGFLKDDAEQLLNGKPLSLELMKAGFSRIKSHYKWNEQKRVYTTSSLRKAFNEGAGSSSDINLSLVGFMRHLGFDAYPVLLSTRENGIVFPSHPSVTSFNYVIALVKMDGKSYLMDATDPFSEINLLPVRCLNDRGRLVNETGGEWIDLTQNRAMKSTLALNLELDKDLLLSGTFQQLSDDYGAYQKRKEILAFKNRDEYVQSLQNRKTGLGLTEPVFENLDTLGKPVLESFKIQLENQVENGGNIVFFNPLVYEREEENPFRIEERQYPVEFSYPTYKMQSIRISIPANYTVESLPKPLVVSLPEKAAKFVYSITVSDNIIQLTSLFQINKALFLPAEYKDLKTFYGMVVAKQAEKVVLKKL
jgi:hypothetical protein